MDSEWMTLKEASEQFQCKPDTLKIRAQNGQLRLYNRTTVPRSEWHPKTRLYLLRNEVKQLLDEYPIERIRSCSRHDPNAVLRGANPEDIEWLTAVEAADLLGWHVETLYGRLMHDELLCVGSHLVPPNQRQRQAKIYFRRDDIEAAAALPWRARLFKPDGKTPSAEDCIYFAGLFDGEGCVQIAHRKRETHIIALSLTNTYEDIMPWISQTFGGTFYIRRLANPRPHHLPSWSWHTAAVGAYRTLQRIGPFLRIKHQQAQIAIALFERIVAYEGSRRKPLGLA